MATLHTFGERLAQERRHKAVRDAQDVYKKDVAKMLGVSESSVGRWENGVTMPDDDTIQRLARYFGVTAAWLRYGQPPRELHPQSGAPHIDMPLAQHPTAPRTAKGTKRR